MRHRKRRRSPVDELVEERAVAADGDALVGLGGDVLTPAATHLVEVELAVVRAADRGGDELRPAGRDDDAAADRLDELRGLALAVGGDDHRPADGEDAVEPARHDVAGETAREPDDVDVRRREREWE